MKRIIYLLLNLSILFSSCQARSINDPLYYVDPYIGSGGHGHVFVGASVPHGAIQVGPQNIHKGWDWCSGYHFSDSVLIGFSHTHLSGTGCTDLGDIQIMPYSGSVRIKRGWQKDISNSYASYYSHENETVSPGYYSLLLDNGVKIEMTATERSAFHKIHYPGNDQSHLMINLEEGNGDKAIETYINVVNEFTIEGYRVSKGWAKHRVCFSMVSDRPITKYQLYNGTDKLDGTSSAGKGVKCVITFASDKVVKLKVGISSVSCENAMENLLAENPGWNFNCVRNAAEKKWRERLAGLNVESKSETVKRIFYTSLFHTEIAPYIYGDINGDFFGHNGEIICSKWQNYSTFSLWDTYRAFHPLYTLIRPGEVPDMIKSMLSIYEQQGKLPIWPLNGSETNQMPGYSAIPVISDAILKDLGGFDYDRAYRYMKSSTTNPNQIGIPFVLEQGFIPTNKVKEATSMAMEYAVSDFCLALVASKLNKADDSSTYMSRGKYYEKYFDLTINHIRPRLSNGAWLDPYDPFESIHGVGHFCEGNGWQYTFFVPQYPEGLISLMGGDKEFMSKLDSLFCANGDMGEKASADISGLIGMYAHGNEPSHHIAYMYAYAGYQWKTAEIVRYIMDKFYTDKPDGIIGNEDCGQMSAWYILSALGFYQVSPAGGLFVFGSPMLDKARIALPNGKEFIIKALNNPLENKYIQSVKYNGEDYTKSYITYDDIMSGGTLEFMMGPTPNKKFGVSESDRPHTRLNY